MPRLPSFAQRLAAHVVPGACACAVAWPASNLLRIVPEKLPAELFSDLSGAYLKWLGLAFVAVGCIAMAIAVFLVGYALGWRILSYFVPWGVAEPHLRSKDGTFTALNRWIASWYKLDEGGGA